MDQMLMLAAAGLPEDIVDQVDRVGWFLPLFALIVPVSIILFFILGKAIYAVLVAAQIAGMVVALRAVIFHLRKSGYTSFQVKIMLGPLYLVACIGTNIVTLICSYLIAKFT